MSEQQPMTRPSGPPSTGTRGFFYAALGGLVAAVAGWISGAFPRPPETPYEVAPTPGVTESRIAALQAEVAESLLTRDMLSAASGALSGLIAGLVVERRLSREPEPPPGGQSVRQALQASAASYSRPRLWFRSIVCLLPVLLGVYLLVAVDRLAGIILTVAFSLSAIYFACLLALKRN
jgi:hypothetical protein